MITKAPEQSSQNDRVENHAEKTSHDASTKMVHEAHNSSLPKEKADKPQVIQGDHLVFNDIFSTMESGARSVASLVEGAGNLADKALTGLGHAIKGATEYTGTAIANAPENIKKDIGSVLHGVEHAGKELENDAKAVGHAIAHGVATSIETAGDAVGHAIEKIGHSVEHAADSTGHAIDPSTGKPSELAPAKPEEHKPAHTEHHHEVAPKTAHHRTPSHHTAAKPQQSEHHSSTHSYVSARASDNA